MRTYRYVKLDPTGNTTCLVLDPAENGDEKKLTRELLKECEQVAYLEEPSLPGAVAAIRLMGGEFCGNAAMAAGAWLVRDELAAGSEMSFLMQVSGAPEPVSCRVRRTGDGFEGTVEMPPIKEIREESIGGLPFTLVRMDGIVHLIREGDALGKEDAEQLLKQAAAGLEDDAVGLLQWNRDAQYMRPLVYVRGSESLVWENGCGSGSAAVGAAEALRAGNGIQVTQVKQPGGVISVSAEAQDGNILSVQIAGRVRLNTETAVEIP
ncbi:MAG: hypothetical protein IKZ98_12295 [Clostridia bacterium]|nr:hypothetical protein [Clostridia bacterium]